MVCGLCCRVLCSAKCLAGCWAWVLWAYIVGGYLYIQRKSFSLGNSGGWRDGGSPGLGVIWCVRWRHTENGIGKDGISG